jgi:hypothetical protein
MSIEQIVYLSSSFTVAPRIMALKSPETYITDRNLTGKLTNCFFIAQEHSNCINSGFFVLNIESKQKIFDLFKSWITNIFATAGVWDGDQVALGYAILDAAQNFQNISEDDRFSYANCAYGDAHGANLCWASAMTSIGFKRGIRWFHDFCLIPFNNKYLSLNLHTKFRYQNFLFHGHDKSSYERALRTHSNLKIRPKKRRKMQKNEKR